VEVLGGGDLEFLYDLNAFYVISIYLCFYDILKDEEDACCARYTLLFFVQ
jgi:hypothetical protein